MDVKEIMIELKARGSESIRKIFLKHGVREPLFGVKIEYLKHIQKKVKKNYQLALDLYATGNADAMYLAGLIADDEKMSAADLEGWVRKAISKNICEYTVPWVAAGSHHGYKLALKWIDSAEEHITAAGWATLSMLVALKEDSDLDIAVFKSLLLRVVKTISTAPNRVRYTMNGFVIATGVYIKELLADAIAASKKIGDVTVDMNGTACKVPDAGLYILKSKEKGTIGKKKKTVKC